MPACRLLLPGPGVWIIVAGTYACMIMAHPGRGSLLSVCGLVEDAMIPFRGSHDDTAAAMHYLPHAQAHQDVDQQDLFKELID